MFDNNRKKVAALIAATIIATVPCHTALAQSKWKGTGGTAANPKSGMWSVGANWDPAGVPASADTTDLSFSSGAGNPVYTANNNIAGTFELQSLTLANDSGVNLIDVISGNTLRFSGNGRIQQNGANNFRIDNPIQLGGGLDLRGLGTGEVRFAGVISDAPMRSGAIFLGDGFSDAKGSFLLNGTNTYSGGTRLGGSIFAKCPTQNRIDRIRHAPLA